ncbi:kynurenine 3-monooxygenase isoform X2 [Anthonomus grandis grandis]|uniref:kynurenine 3-monooxygenase isoform X2 n=1 Tax=Anthonomus grandis grandis TaxID=2921223 RepID=UPI002165CBF0|nr:kynurenine 3-monooxygenase isoform X2 [Anthonomus grandis grandis]
MYEKDISSKKGKSAIVIGGGLVGALCACVLAQRGYQVTLFEKREDIRKQKTARGRSINLALSHRGRKALRLIHMENEILKLAIPMEGRFLHSINGKTQTVPYDNVTNQCIYSVGRNFLNAALLNAAEKHPNVKLHFNHELKLVDFKEGTVTLQSRDKSEGKSCSADLIIGADGAFSVMRSFLQKTPLFDFSQRFIDHGYLELSVPSERGGLLKGNFLHIWPRREFMMIALPNQDKSWTVTLFMPFQHFKDLDNPEKLVEFFGATFPDALPCIGESELKKSFFENSPSPLVSIKCGRYHMGDKFLIIGDAAHAMVPFYGQGMNAGFEDCTLLNDLLSRTEDNVSKTIKLFSEKRQKDAHAICDLALYNYTEMRDLVTKPSYKFRKMLDKLLGTVFPESWIPLYNSVSFTHMGYSRCVENKEWQDKTLHTDARPSYDELVYNNDEYPQKLIDDLIDEHPTWKEVLKTNPRLQYQPNNSPIFNNDTICPSYTTRQYFPRPLKDINDEEFIVINHGEYVQGFDKVECVFNTTGYFQQLCLSNTHDRYGCKQQYTYRTLYVLQNNRISEREFNIPSNCVCGPLDTF